MKFRLDFASCVVGNLSAWALVGFFVTTAPYGHGERGSARIQFDFSVAETYCPEVGPCKPGQQRKPKPERVERHHEGGDDLWKSENYPLG